MQKAPTGGYSGVSGRRSAGPGEYEPTNATKLTKPKASASAFGNSRVQRDLFHRMLATDTPGPGTYGSDSKSSAKPSAAFMSAMVASFAFSALAAACLSAS